MMIFVMKKLETYDFKGWRAKKGITAKAAAAHLGVNIATFFRWQQRGAGDYNAIARIDSRRGKPHK